MAFYKIYFNGISSNYINKNYIKKLTSKFYKKVNGKTVLKYLIKNCI